jgi:hypothetical protein
VAFDEGVGAEGPLGLPMEGMDWGDDEATGGTPAPQAHKTISAMTTIVGRTEPKR